MAACGAHMRRFFRFLLFRNLLLHGLLLWIWRLNKRFFLHGGLRRAYAPFLSLSVF